MPDGSGLSMGLTPVASPSILPPFAARSSVLIAANAGLDAQAVPDDLREAVPSRRRDYLAGRRCARLALSALVGGAPDVPRGPDGAPVWPEGVVGSITHSGTHSGALASAAVALGTDARGIGIDTERLERFGNQSTVARLVVLPSEARIGHPALPDDLRLPLVFSAKEALFKCLYPLVRRRFYFESAELISVNVAEGTFQARLTTDLAPGFDPSLEIPGRFVWDDEFVHTGVWLPPIP
jgi:enterobactin synthetase component D